MCVSNPYMTLFMTYFYFRQTNKQNRLHLNLSLLTSKYSIPSTKLKDSNRKLTKINFHLFSEATKLKHKKFNICQEPNGSRQDTKRCRLRSRSESSTHIRPSHRCVNVSHTRGIMSSLTGFFLLFLCFSCLILVLFLISCYWLMVSTMSF